MTNIINMSFNTYKGNLETIQHYLVVLFSSFVKINDFFHCFPVSQSCNSNETRTRPPHCFICE